MKRLRRITIDPGLGGTGWSVWNEEWALKAWGVVIPKGDENEKLDKICSRLIAVCMTYAVREVYIEYPEVMRHDIALSGSLTKLGAVVGVIAGALCFAGEDRTLEWVRVLKWKGQWPKDVVARKVKKFYPNFNIVSHAYDAIGIGLYKKGVI